MINSPNIVQFIRLVKEAHEEWRSTWVDLDETQMIRPLLAGGWSVKDMIAHITWHEREMNAMIRSRSFVVGSDLWNLPLDERNAAIFKLNQNRLLIEVLSEAEEAHAKLMALLETLSDVDLQDASHFKEMPLDWKPCDVIAGNTYAHYREHKLAQV